MLLLWSGWIPEYLNIRNPLPYVDFEDEDIIWALWTVISDP